MSTVSPIPKGYHTLTPHLVISGAKEAIEYYKQAFGAEVGEVALTPDGSLVMNATLKIGDSMFMIADEMDMMEYWVSPNKLNGTTVGVHIYVEDVDALFAQAEKAGIKVMFAPMDAFWGDRYCQFVDKFGHAWSIATHIEDVSPEEADRRGREWFENYGKESKQ